MKIKSTQDYMNKLAELGIENPASQLRTRFREGGLIGNFRESELIDEGATTRDVPPPITEDYSHLNPKNTKRRAAQARKAWTDLTPAERARRISILSQSGKEGGKARKFSFHQGLHTQPKKIDKKL